LCSKESIGAQEPKPKTNEKIVKNMTSTTSTITDPIDAAIAEVVVDDVVVDALLTQAAAAAANTHNNKRKAEELETTTTTRTSTTRVSWEERIRMLKEYKSQHGDLLIPIRYKANPSLGKFVHNTREQYKLFYKRTPANYKKKCSLTQERIDELNALGFVWNTQRTERQNEDWEKRYAQLVQFQQTNGHCLIPHGYEPDPGLAEWVHRQRTTYASMIKQQQQQEEENQDSNLQIVQQRMKKLQDIGFNFTVHSDKWMVHYQQLVKYKQTFGNCQVPTHYTENTKLGRWVHTQRHQRRLQIKGKKSSMTPQRYQLLQQLGFAWEVRPPLERPRATWQQRYDEIRHFHMTHGHFRFIQHPNPVEPELIQWAQEQKARLRAIANTTTSNSKDTTNTAAARRLAPERVRLLHEIGFHKDVDLGDSSGSGNTCGNKHEDEPFNTHMIPPKYTDANHHPSELETTGTAQNTMNQPITTNTETVLDGPIDTATTTTDAVDGTMELALEGSELL
jgi:hypothetical protein